MEPSYYYIRRKGEIHGPALPNQLIDAALRGVILPSDDLSISRDGPWRSAATCVEFGFFDEENHADDEQVIVWEGAEQHGPYSDDQLRELQESGEISTSAYVADIDGRMTRLGTYLGIDDTAAEVEFESVEESDDVETPLAEPTLEPEDPPRKRQHSVTPPKKTAPKITLNSPLEALEELLREERLAAPLQPLPRDSSSRKSRRNRPAKRPEAQSAGDGSPQELTFIKTIGASVRSRSFERVYRAVLALVAVQAGFYLAVVSALQCKFLGRVLALSIEVFAPFGSETEPLKDTDLIYAGITTVCLCAEFLLPIFFLVKWDADFRFWGISAAVGVLLSMVVTADDMATLADVLQGIGALCGFGIAAGGLWIALMTPPGSGWMIAGVTVSVVTAVAATGLAILNSSGVLEMQVLSLPPLLKGVSTVALFPFGFCCLGIWLPVPLFCFRLLATRADESTQTYITSILRGAGILGLTGLFFLEFLGGGSSLRYLSVPLALLPLTLGSVICAMSQPVMWNLQPAYTAR